MAKSTRRPHRIYTGIMWLLSIIFAGFLIGFGNLIIADVPTVDRNINQEEFIDKTAMSEARKQETLAEASLRTLTRQQEDAETVRQSAQRDYRSAKTSFDNWINARTATEASDQNPEVLTRTRGVEQLQMIERQAQRDVQDVQIKVTQARRKLEDARDWQKRLRQDSQPEYRAATRKQQLRIFLFRLALTLPLLIIGGWLVAKKRESSYWPLYRGFVIFALFAFFVELVPYLPSYGGYVRYAVGIIMVMIAGHFIIRWMRKYLAEKQAEESRSEGERRQSIEYETALKKIAAKTCPGCDRSIVTRDGIDTDFCAHCGIRLQEKCGSCGERNISFHRFCLSCGCSSEAATTA